MKIVIHTQFRENYGSEEKPYWKFKGGDVYVVPVDNNAHKQIEKIRESGIPTLTGLIQNFGPMSEEYVAHWVLTEDDAKVSDPWETPFTLSYTDGRWVAKRTVKNDEYGYMRQEIESKTEEYDMLPRGERGNYRASYKLRDGKVYTLAQLEEYFKEYA